MFPCTDHGISGTLESGSFYGKAVYGLCEIHREEIRNARLVANPGCYPTSVLLPLIPLLKAGLVEKDDIIVDSKSGVSGAGRGLSLKTHICETGESFCADKQVGRDHRHIPEMEQELALAGRGNVRYRIRTAPPPHKPWHALLHLCEYIRQMKKT